MRSLSCASRPHNPLQSKVWWEKGKEQIDEISEEDFYFQDLLGQELTDAEKEELKKYAISCGYKSGAMLFGGVNEGKLRPIMCTGMRIVRAWSAIERVMA